MNFTFLQAVDPSALIFVIGLLTLGTNVVTEVLKRTIRKIPAVRFPAQITALIVAMVLTVGSFFAYAAIAEIEVEWYMAAGAVVTGFFVSYGAQFGFDKLNELIGKYGKGV